MDVRETKREAQLSVSDRRSSRTFSIGIEIRTFPKLPEEVGEPTAGLQLVDIRFSGQNVSP